MAEAIRRKAKTVFEAVVGHAGRVDRATRTIFNVKVLGQKSAWNRTYMDEAINRDYVKYEGVKVFMGEVGGVKVGPAGMSLDLRHQKFTKKPKTPLAGTLRGVKPTRQGVFANLVVEAGATGDLLLDAAETCPQTFGLSHVATVESAQVPTMGGGQTEMVRAFGPVHYCEVVSSPASVRNLFEGLDMANEVAAAPAAQMGLEEAFQALEMAIVHEYEGADRIAALKVVDKFKSQLLGDGSEGEGEESADDAAAATPEGTSDASARPISAIRRPVLAQQVAETNTLLRQFIEGQASGTGRRLSPVRSGGRAPVQEGDATSPQGGGRPKPAEKIPYGDRDAMRRFMES